MRKIIAFWPIFFYVRTKSMTKDEQIKSYMDLLLHTNNLFGWIYDEHMQMLFYHLSWDDYQGFDALFQLQVPPCIKRWIALPSSLYLFLFQPCLAD